MPEVKVTTTSAFLFLLFWATMSPSSPVRASPRCYPWQCPAGVALLSLKPQFRGAMDGGAVLTVILLDFGTSRILHLGKSTHRSADSIIIFRILCCICHALRKYLVIFSFAKIRPPSSGKIRRHHCCSNNNSIHFISFHLLCKSIYGQRNLMLIRGRTTQTKNAKVALALANFSLLFPFFLSSSCYVLISSLLLGRCLCLYNSLSLLIAVYYFLLPGFICICCLLSLSLSLSCCGTQLLIIILVQLLDLCLLSVMNLGSVVLFVVTSSFQHFFAFDLPISTISFHVC